LFHRAGSRSTSLRSRISGRTPDCGRGEATIRRSGFINRYDH
jgi:hypothetical protein